MQVIDNKNILKSYIGDKQIVRKILNGNTVYGSPDFVQYYNIQGYDNYEVVGSPTITDGVASGFSSSNYLETSSALSVADNTPFDFYMTFTCVSGNTGVTAFSGYNDSLSFGYYDSGKKPVLRIRQANNTAYKQFVVNYIMSINNTYSINAVYNGTNLVCYLYDSGSSLLYTETFNGENLNISSSTAFKIGIRGNSAFLGSIDLNNTYIKVNGKYYFNGNSNYKELLWCNPKVYLINNSDAYINTGVNTISTMDVNTKFTFPDNVVRDLFGSNNFYITKSSSANKINFGYATSSYKTLGSATKTPVNSICEAYFKGSEVGVNGLTSTIERNFDANEIQLFKKHSRTGKNWHGKLYYLDLLNNNTLIRKFVPVPQGLKIGSFTVPYNSIFDIVTQTFYEKQGTGYFTWGVDQ